jgi:hypothetical protein
VGQALHGECSDDDAARSLQDSIPWYANHMCALPALILALMWYLATSVEQRCSFVNRLKPCLWKRLRVLSVADEVGMAHGLRGMRHELLAH